MSSHFDCKPGRRGGIGPVAGLAVAIVGALTGIAARAEGVSPGAPQSAQATPAPSPPPAASTPAEPADPTPAHVDAARQLILATGISRSFQFIVPEFMDQIGVSVTQTRPDLAGDLTAVLGDLKPEFDKQADEMIELSARIYARLLTEDEIRAILTFFRSDAGNKYVNAQPLFLNQLVAGMQAWQQKISVNMMTRVRQEMKKKGHEL